MSKVDGFCFKERWKPLLHTPTLLHLQQYIFKINSAYIVLGYVLVTVVVVPKLQKKNNKTVLLLEDTYHLVS